MLAATVVDHMKQTVHYKDSRTGRSNVFVDTRHRQYEKKWSIASYIDKALKVIIQNPDVNISVTTLIIWYYKVYDWLSDSKLATKSRLKR